MKPGLLVRLFHLKQLEKMFQRLSYTNQLKALCPHDRNVIEVSFHDFNIHQWLIRAMEFFVVRLNNLDPSVIVDEHASQ